MPQPVPLPVDSLREDDSDGNISVLSGTSIYTVDNAGADPDLDPFGVVIAAPFRLPHSLPCPYLTAAALLEPTRGNDASPYSEDPDGSQKTTERDGSSQRGLVLPSSTVVESMHFGCETRCAHLRCALLCNAALEERHAELREAYLRDTAAGTRAAPVGETVIKTTTTNADGIPTVDRAAFSFARSSGNEWRYVGTEDMKVDGPWNARVMGGALQAARPRAPDGGDPRDRRAHARPPLPAAAPVNAPRRRGGVESVEGCLGAAPAVVPRARTI